MDPLSTTALGSAPPLVGSSANAGLRVLAVPDCPPTVAALSVAAPEPLAALGTAVDHAALAAGLPSLVLLATVAGTLSMVDAVEAVRPRSILAVSALVGCISTAIGALGIATGGGYGVVALAVGVGLLATTGAVVVHEGSIPFPYLLAMGLVVPAGVGVALGLEVGAFGWGADLPVPLQAVALAVAVGAFLPMGHAARRGSNARWPLAALIVGAPFLVVAPLVPVGGVGPFFVALILTPWALVAAVAGVPAFALGGVAAATEYGTPPSESLAGPDTQDGSTSGVADSGGESGE